MERRKKIHIFHIKLFLLKMNKITVVIPTFQPSDYVFETLSALTAQEYKNFEVIIVLNGPEEPYKSRIKNFIDDHKIENITLLYSPKPGVSVARNMALECNLSDYVVFVDDDDLINSEYLYELQKYAHPKNVVAANFVSFKDGDNKQGGVRDYCGREFYSCQKGKNRLKPAKCPSVFSSCCGKLIPTAIIGKNRFKENIFCGEDSFFMFQLLGTGISEVVYSPRAEYRRRIRKNSASRKRYAVAKIIKNRLELLGLYTYCYFGSFSKISPIFYLRRIAAVCKGFFYLISQ